MHLVQLIVLVVGVGIGRMRVESPQPGYREKVL